MDLGTIIRSPGGFVPRATVAELTADERGLLAAGYVEFDRSPAGSWGLRVTAEGLSAYARGENGPAPAPDPEPPRPSRDELWDALIDARDAVVEAASRAVDMAHDPAVSDAALEAAAGEVGDAVGRHRVAKEALEAEEARNRAAGTPQPGDRIVGGNLETYRVASGSAAYLWLVRIGRGPLESDLRVPASGYTWDDAAGLWREGRAA